MLLLFQNIALLGRLIMCETLVIDISLNLLMMKLNNELSI
jgi:hypothetical protein